MTRKITHTKRGSMYHGVTGTRKAFSLTNVLLKTSSSSRKRTTSKSSHNTSYSSGVSSNNKSVNHFVAVILVIVGALIFAFFLTTMCSKPSKNYRHKPKHPKSYYTGHNYMPKITENCFAQKLTSFIK